MSVRGRACEPDGVYGSDTLQYRRVDAAPGVTWTTVGSFTAPQCTPDGVLYTWNTAAAGILEGLYYLRLTVINACGLTSTDQVVVYADKSFSMNEASIRSPQNGAIVGGGVCIDGSTWDHCFDNYTVKYRPAAAGVFLPVEPLVPSYTTPVLNDPLANWNTKAGGAAVPKERQRIVVAHIEAREQCREGVAALDARFAHERILPLQKLLDLIDDRRRRHGFHDGLRLKQVEVQGGGRHREGRDRGRQRQQRDDSAELEARAGGAIDATPATREHAEPQAGIGRKAAHSIG